MCGFAGFLGGSSNLSQVEGETLLEKMNEKIRSRGPDDKGFWFSQNVTLDLDIEDFQL